jgi:hypothetical protein
LTTQVSQSANGDTICDDFLDNDGPGLLVTKAESSPGLPENGLDEGDVLLEDLPRGERGILGADNGLFRVGVSRGSRDDIRRWLLLSLGKNSAASDAITTPDRGRLESGVLTRWSVTPWYSVEMESLGRVPL